METLLMISLGVNVGLIFLSLFLLKQNAQAIKKAEKNIFDLFMAGAYADRLAWFETLNQIPQKTPTVFMGDSLIQEWPLQELFQTSTYLNRGIGGDTTQHLLKRLELTLANLDPHQIVILIGTNDLVEEDFSITQTTGHIEAIVRTLKDRYPKTTIHLLSLLPTGDPQASKNNAETIGTRDNQTIATINQALQTITGVLYHNLNDLLQDDQGFLKLSYTREGLHLSPQGYRLITEHLRQHGL